MMSSDYHNEDLIDKVKDRHDLMAAQIKIRDAALEYGASIDQVTYAICWNIAIGYKKPLDK